VRPPSIELVKVTDEMKSFNAYAKLRLERTNERHMGARLKRAAEAEKEDKKYGVCLGRYGFCFCSSVVCHCV